MFVCFFSYLPVCFPENPGGGAGAFVVVEVVVVFVTF